MKRVIDLDERLIYEVLSAVSEIPEGRVATYGQIARLIGRFARSRHASTFSFARSERRGCACKTATRR